MAILNYGSVTRAIETLLRQKLTGFIITRNARKNADPNKCLAPGEGWIGIYRGPINYAAHVMGNRPWLVDPEPFVNIQVASAVSSDDAEDKLQDAEIKVIDILDSDRTIGNTVHTILGYRMDYEYNSDTEIYFHGVNVHIMAQTRA
jgi:hypothetical protein